MNLQNGYKVIYEVAEDGKRTFYATQNGICDPAIDDKIIEATIGEYKLIYEKAGQIYGSTSGIPTDSDYCFEEFNKVFKLADEATDASYSNVEDQVPAIEDEVTTEEPVTPEEPKSTEPETNDETEE